MLDSKTDKMKKIILEHIAKSTSENGYSPSVREICDEVGIKSTSTGQKYLNELQYKDGLLTSMPGKARTWQVIKKLDT